MKLFAVIALLIFLSHRLAGTSVPRIFSDIFASLNKKTDAVKQADEVQDNDDFNEQLTNLRIEYIKNQILKRLGLKEKPSVLHIPLPEPIAESDKFFPEHGLRNTGSDDFYGKVTQVIMFPEAWNGLGSDPRTSDRIISTFSVDERLALYNYCINHTEGPPVPKEFDVNIIEKKESKPLSLEEEIARDRNAKRRRIKYKAVHTGRSKSYTEVIREVIGNQMELYQEYVTSTMTEEEESNSNNQNNNDLQNVESTHNQDKSSEIINNNANQNNVTKMIRRSTSSIGRHSSYSEKSTGKTEHSESYLDPKNDYKRYKEHERRRELSRDRDRERHRDRDRHKSSYRERRHLYEKNDSRYDRHSQEKHLRYNKRR